VIEGLKLSMSGEEIRTLLGERLRGHERCAERWKREQARTVEDQTEDEPLLPDQICENEAARHEWRLDVLAFIRDHVEPAETYRLGEADLEFAELLPEKPGWMEQQEYEQKTGVAFNLQRLTKEVRRLCLSGYALAEQMADAADHEQENDN
jgi:hypothetical protein